MLTPEELAALPPKATRDPDVVALYRAHEYLTAYGLHTDRRVRLEGPEAAAGADASRDNWTRHGQLQRDFLIAQGIRPGHRLLDFGCGGGRLARQIVPYLEVGHYHGVDLSAEAVAAAQALSRAEGWSARRPIFWLRTVTAPAFDVIWAHSVVPHLPPDLIAAMMRQAAALLAADGRFYWSYMPSAETVRYGLTQYRAPFPVYVECAARAGLLAEDVPDWVQTAGHAPGRWTYGQRLAVSRHV